MELLNKKLNSYTNNINLKRSSMNPSSIGFLKVREVKAPRRAHAHDAGIDFFLPKMDFQMVIDLKAKNPHIRRWSEIIQCESEWLAYPEEKREYYLRMIPGLRLLIPSGIKVAIEDKASALIAFNKSGLSANAGITVTAQVVDADYTGEVHVGILNTSDDVCHFQTDDKIGQFVHVPINLSLLVELDEDEYKSVTDGSDRGEGGFGSTDKK